MNLLRKIWAVYGILVFFILWIALLPLYLFAFAFFPSSWVKYIIWFSHQVYTRLFFGLTLIRFQVEGLERLDRKQTYVIVSNHLTTLDFMINARAYPGVYKFLAKEELTKIPIFGWLIVKKLCVLVNRRDKSSRSRSMSNLQSAIQEGYSIFLYPEGTRNRSKDPLLPFHKGAFIAAIETGTPIAIQTLIGVKKISGLASGLDYWPGKVKIVWSDPISVEGLTIQDRHLLAQKVADVMKATLEREGVYNPQLSPGIAR